MIISKRLTFRLLTVFASLLLVTSSPLVDVIVEASKVCVCDACEVPYSYKCPEKNDPQR